MHYKWRVGRNCFRNKRGSTDDHKRGPFPATATITDLVEESSACQATAAKGKVLGHAEEVRRLLIRIGTIRFGLPGEHDVEAIDAAVDLDQLELLVVRAVLVKSWSELFG